MVGAEYQPMVMMKDLHLDDGATNMEWKPKWWESGNESEIEKASMSDESESDVSTIQPPSPESEWEWSSSHGESDMRSLGWISSSDEPDPSVDYGKFSDISSVSSDSTFKK